MVYNLELLKNFQILQDLSFASLKSDPANKFKLRAYKNAILYIKSLNYELDLENFNLIGKQIGDKIKGKIKEFLETGKIDEVEAALTKLDYINTNKGEKEKTIELFSQIWGVGEKGAIKLWEFGFRTIDDLIRNPIHLNHSQTIGLNYYEELKMPLTREYVKIFYLMVLFVISFEFKNRATIEIAGSFRRGKKELKDIDILIISDTLNLKDVTECLERWNIITDTLSLGREKFMGIAHCPSNKGHHFRLDLEFLRSESKASGLLHFTGSSNFNIKMRNEAKKMGLLLNEHGLYKNGIPFKVDTERDIFDILGIKYLEPKDRNVF
jgi:DNA polymerase/3'-5' exonuclease PolX